MNFCALHALFLLAHGGKIHSDLLYRNGREREYRLLDVEHFDDAILFADIQLFCHFDCQLELMRIIQDAFGLYTTAVKQSADQSSSMHPKCEFGPRRQTMLAILASENMNA